MKSIPELACPAGDKAYLELRRLAKANGKTPEAVASRYVLERVVARIFSGGHADRFALKGGMILMRAEGVGPVQSRATADIDLHLPDFDGPIEALSDMMREALSAPAEEDDGVRYALDTLQVGRSREGLVAGGTVALVAQVGPVGVKVRCDVGFDDRPVLAAGVDEEMPPVLPGRLRPFRVRRVPFSWTLADKLQGLVRHGDATTRLRDFYDMHVILTRDAADPAGTAEAMVRTFALFGSDLPATMDGFPALQEPWALRNAAAFEREVRKRGFAVPVPPLPEACRAIREAVAPILAHANALRDASAR